MRKCGRLQASRIEAFTELAVFHIITDVHDVCKRVLEREELGHVSYSSGLALPHIRLPYLERVYRLCGVLKSPVTVYG